MCRIPFGSGGNLVTTLHATPTCRGQVVHIPNLRLHTLPLWLHWEYFTLAVHKGVPGKVRSNMHLSLHVFLPPSLPSSPLSLSLSLAVSLYFSHLLPSPLFSPSLSSPSIPLSSFLPLFIHLLPISKYPSSPKLYIVFFPGAPLTIGFATPWTSTALCSGSMADSTFSILLSQRGRFRNSSPIKLSMTGMILDFSRWRHWDKGDFLPRLLTTSVQRYSCLLFALCWYVIILIILIMILHSLAARLEWQCLRLFFTLTC